MLQGSASVRAPDGRVLRLRFEPLGGTWHASVNGGPESDGLDLREAVALATGLDQDDPWVVELERDVDPEYAAGREARRGNHAATR